MRHRVAGRHLGRETSHRIALYRNLVTDLLRYERITTTEAKAKEIRPMAERIITLARKGDLHSRRQAMRFVYDPRVVKRTFDEIGPRMASRPGGYLRITSLEPRKGDGARMATIELVDYTDAPATPRPQRVTATATPAARAAAPAAAAPAAAEPEAAEDLEETTVEAELEEAPEVGSEADAPVAEAEEQPEASVAGDEAEDAAPSEEDGAEDRD